MFEWLEIDREQTDDTYPMDVEHGFWFTHVFISYPQAIHAFVALWGGLDTETLKRVLLQGEGDDRIAALWCLALRNGPDAKTLLLPFLESADPKERWSSAMCLGEMHEPKALPVLLAMLTEFFPMPLHPRPLGDHDQFWFEDRRWLLPRLLRPWQEPTVVPAMRDALERQVASERFTPYDTQIFWMFQDSLAYELGYRGAVGTLTMSPLSSHRLRLALNNMVIGVFDRQEHPERMYGMTISIEMSFKDRLKPSLIRFFQERFGFSEQVADAVLTGYSDDWSLRGRESKEH